MSCRIILSSELVGKAVLFEFRHGKTCLMPNANNISAKQPAHPRSLIGIFFVHCLHRIIIIPLLAKSKLQDSS